MALLDLVKNQERNIGNTRRNGLVGSWNLIMQSQIQKLNLL